MKKFPGQISDRLPRIKKKEMVKKKTLTLFSITRQQESVFALATGTGIGDFWLCNNVSGERYEQFLSVVR